MRVLSIERTLHNVYVGFYSMMSKDYDFEILSYDHPNVKQIKSKLGIKVNVLKKINFLSSDFGSYYVGMYKFLKKNDYDLIHCRTYFSVHALVALFYALVNKKKIVFSEEQNQDPISIIPRLIFGLYVFILRLIFNLFKINIIAISDVSYRYLKGKGFKKVHLLNLPYIVNEKKRTPKKITNKLNMICVARFEWLKAHFVLVEAINYIVSNSLMSRSDLKVTLVGEGKLKDQTLSLITKYKLDDIFIIKSNMPKQKLYAEYKKNDLFVLSSRIEMLGAVVFEAMENSLPVIVSDVAGSSDAIEDGVNGYKFKCLDHVDLANKILMFMKDKNKNVLGKSAYDSLAKNYAEKSISKRMANIINSI